MDKAERQGLPIDPSLPEDTKAIMALQEGHERGWFSYRYPYGGGDEGERWYLVTLSGQRDRWLRSSEVLPWVLGVADTLGQPDRIAYRDGLP